MGLNLSHGPRLNARTTPRIAQALKNLVAQMQHDGVVFDGRIMSTEALISALVMTYLEMPYKDQLELVLNAIPALKQECDNAQYIAPKK